ncbi:TPA: hypothetical protein DEB00_00395 [Candidatus Uhrbacteria bacterium]|nr:hypothetical protein [Candidatus Uhrbacteria bacterium]
MPLRYTILFIGFGTLLAIGGLVAIVYSVSPADLVWWGMLVFYALVFLITLGTLTILGTVVRVRFLKADIPIRQLTRSFRQGVFLGVLACVGLFLSHLQLLTTWSLLLLVLALAFLELFFLTSRSRAT